MNKIKLNVAMALLVTVGLTSFASAQTAALKGTVDVRLTILESCKIDGGDIAVGAINQFGVLDFGTHTKGSTGIKEAGNSNDSTTTGLTINVECTADYPNFKIRLASSKNEGESAGTRQMVHATIPTSMVQYTVLQEDKTTVIKNGDLVSAKPILANTKTEYKLHSTATLGGDEVAGTYSDTLNLEITF